MVKLYASLLALTFATSLSLATSDQRERHPFYTHGFVNDGDLLERDLDEEFSGREYLRDASVDLEARQPRFFGEMRGAFKDVGKVAHKGFHIAKKVAENKMVQSAAESAAEAAIPGGGEAMMAAKVAGKLVKLKKSGNAINKARKTGQASRKRGKVGQRIQTAKKVVNGAKKVDKVSKKVNQIESSTPTPSQTPTCGPASASPGAPILCTQNV